MKPEQIPMFPDLPTAPDRVADEAPAPVKEPKPRAAHKRARQMSLPVKLYAVEGISVSVTVQAHSPSAAKYLAFKKVRETGLYCYDGGFFAFVSGGVKVAEVRQ